MNNYRYTGEQWDADLGMYFLRARYYKPELGRFWTMDTFEGSQLDPLSLNKYLYAHNNPVMMMDPSGRMSLNSTLSAMTIGTAIGMWSSIAANHALGRAQTYSSILQGGAFGAVAAPFAIAVPAVGVGLGVAGLASSGLIAWGVFTDPNATPSQKIAATALVAASLYGTAKGVSYYRYLRGFEPNSTVTINRV